MFKVVKGEEERWPCFLYTSSEMEHTKGVRVASREALRNDESKEARPCPGKDLPQTPSHGTEELSPNR